ncbi:thioredoxin family protein [Mariniflexile sp. AS56]|uniref:thioredoxin family protein n=1 Tax=Mariniflexile sp. AS56 TaxID=3063957 RepID=UPI0026E92308|nr:thioredoxin family protein [Mariniflexile sp. AS56]MDO7172690.1 thioredoxin family protein [Mariniflexile sp. AS56]
MANTPSNMLPLGTTAPYFELPDTISDTLVNLETIKGNTATVIMFICNHCPFVIHVNKTLTDLANTYSKKGIGFVAISSNDAVKYPQDGPDEMKLHGINENYPFPYLYDENQDIAKAYDAACTPDFYVFNAELKLTYRGQLDDSRPGNNKPATGNDLKNALDCLLENTANTAIQKPSIGCNIKWKTPS